MQCVNLGVSEESKAYELYEPVEGEVIISRDVVFEELKCWNWNKEKNDTWELTTLPRGLKNHWSKMDLQNKVQ